MHKLVTIGLALMLALLVSACGGSSTPPPAGAFSTLNFDIATDPGSSVSAAQVAGEYGDVTHADLAWIAGALPAGSTALAAMRFTPKTAAGAGFSGVLSATLDTEKGTSAVVDNQRVAVFRGDAAARTLTRTGSVQTGAGGEFTLPLDYLGLVVFATRLPGEHFTVAAFADQSAAGVGQPVNFRASAQNAVGTVTYNWSFGDGATATGSETQHSYAAPGAYNASLSAVDSAGNVAPGVSTAITVTATAPPLTAVAVNVTRNGPRNNYAFDYDATLTGGTGPYTYEWTFDILNPVVESETTTVASVLGHVFAAYGQFQGRLKVTDSLGATATSALFDSDNRLIPLITAVVPGEAEVGETVVIQGDGFGALSGDDRVTLGGLFCSVDQAAGGWSDTAIHVIVPAAAVNADFVVETEVDSNGMPFKVLPPAPGGPGGGQF